MMSSTHDPAFKGFLNTAELGGVKGRILLVDDEDALRRAYARMIESAGFSVRHASNGTEAGAALMTENFDVILSDINMPGMSGIQLLRFVRERDLDVPVLLITGCPSTETAVQAVEYGALRYLTKPIDRGVLIAAIEEAVKLRRIAGLKREAVQCLETFDKQVGDRAGLEAILSRSLNSLYMVFQPIVSWKRQKIIAYEALVRTGEPLLPNPGALLSAAERLGCVYDVGRAIRGSVACILSEHLGIDADIFINLHPHDLLDPALLSPDAPLTSFARHVVLEITERATLDNIPDASVRVGMLRGLGYRIAIDDLGAGYAGLNYFSQLTPEVVKLDMGLVRDIHREGVKQKLVGSLTSLCTELGMAVIAEGVETVDERDTIIRLGCDLLQGFLFAKPAQGFPAVSW